MDSGQNVSPALRLLIVLTLTVLPCALPLLALLLPNIRRWALILTLLLTAFSLGCGALIYYWSGGFGPDPSLNDDLPGFFIITACAPLIAAVCALVVARVYRSVLCASLLVVYFAFLLALHFIDYTPVKPFSRFYGVVQTGMTPPEIYAALQREFPQTGHYAVPVFYSDAGNNNLTSVLDATSLASFQNGKILIQLDRNSYNDEIIQLNFAANHVVHKSYSTH
jgi:hypothetical protein